MNKKNIKCGSDKSSGKMRVDSEMTKINANVAGMDLGSEEHWVCVPSDRAEKNVQRFGVYTSDFRELAIFLRSCGVLSVAMESTGVYWIPLYEFLDKEGFEVVLVNARHLKSVAGRPKTDIYDCQWIQRLHSYGLLQGSFRPSDKICELRGLTRHRASLVAEAGTKIQHMQKALQQMNVRLDKAVSDITGKTGLEIIKRIIAGERNPAELAKLRDSRVHKSEKEIASALDGNYRSEHLFALKQSYDTMCFIQKQMEDCDSEIKRVLDSLDRQLDSHTAPPLQPRKGSKRSNKNQPSFDLRPALYEIYGVDLTQVDGFQASTVLNILAELGPDLSKFRFDKNFTSFLGLCVNKEISGGRVLKNKTRKVQSRAAKAFRLAAQSLKDSNCYLGRFYRKIKIKAGAQKAITATARKLAVIFFNMVKKKQEYKPIDPDTFDKKQQDRIIKNMKKKAQSMGFDLVPVKS
jgi:transposase